MTLISRFDLLNVMLIMAGGAIFLFLLYAALVSFKENERRAAAFSIILAAVLPLPYAIVGLLDFEWQRFAAWGLLAFSCGGLLLLLFPTGKKAAAGNDRPGARIDERDIMFSRNLLEPGSERFRDYYGRHPDKKLLDDRFRSRPGLLEPGTTYYHPLTFSSTRATYTVIEHLRDIVDGPIGQPGIVPDAARMTRYIKRWALQMGAVSVGVTRLEDYHLYSHVGRGPDYGKPVELDHPYAVALTVEMDKDMLGAAPAWPVIMESSKQYLMSGMIALQAAKLIRNLGYPARAHIDGNYRVVCPLVARDAGLGEIGRMGLLMTPALGPRVRISVVTTSLPLIPDTRPGDRTMIDFCRRCKKCAHVCPARAIPFDGRAEIDGARRWRIDSEACFTFWCQAGTDCARCVISCPYAHPDHFLHNLIRRGARNSSLFRDMARRMDDFFYGRKPAPKNIPDWINGAVAALFEQGED